jgi:hypothetical protein
MSGWARRIRRPAGPLPLQEVQAAARDLADQAGLAPGKMRVVFQTVSDVALLGTVLVSGALATVHLYKALSPRHKEDHPGPEPAGGDRSPPNRRGPRATAAADDRRGYEGDGYRSR